MTPEVDIVAPLDAYATAKPGEPTWTVQGGDPLGGPLLRVWALFARIQAQVIPDQGVQYVYEQLLAAANGNPPESDRERDALLVRATQTEQVSWLMDEYRKSGHVEEAEEEADTHLDEFARIDLHDLKVRCAQKLSSIRSDLLEMVDALGRKGFTDLDTLNQLRVISGLTKDLNEIIEPRRLFKRG